MFHKGAKEKRRNGVTEKYDEPSHRSAVPPYPNLRILMDVHFTYFVGYQTAISK